MEEFNEIGGIKKIRDSFDIVRSNNYGSKEIIRNEFRQLYIQHFEITNNADTVSTVLLKLFDVNWMQVKLNPCLSSY